MASATRRGFIATAGLALAAGLAPAAAHRRRIPPGLQLWTVKQELARDFEGTLRALGRMGYRRVEAAGWHGRSPREFRAAVERAGLECVAAHHGLADFIADGEARLAFAREVGVRYVVASSPAPKRPLAEGKSWSHAMAEAMTLEDWRSNAQAMDQIGRRARAMGLRFAYHNHSAEFLNYGGRLPMDEIARLTDPANVVFELDIGWVAGAGYDPAEVLDRYRSRTHLLHIKDIASPERIPGRLVSDERTTPIGQGTVDWQAVFRAAARAPIHSWFVEIEEPFAVPPLEALRQSLQFLRRMSA